MGSEILLFCWKYSTNQLSEIGGTMACILAIDDERSIADLIQEALAGCGHTVSTAFNGRQGLRRLETDRFDLVVTDICMPEIDGNCVLRHIRQSDRPMTPVIGISGTPWLLKESGFDAVLSKPFGLLTLIDTVTGLLNDGSAFSQGGDVFRPSGLEPACRPSP
jgi:CheY-like chemotaxis protein